MTAYNLSAGRTWVTGESVTATKLNTAMTGSTITITNNLIGAASSTNENIPQWDGTTGALLKDGKIFTTDVDSGSLDTEVPSAKACYDALPTATGSGTEIVTGGIKQKWFRSSTYTSASPGEKTITLSGFSGTPHHVQLTVAQGSSVAMAVTVGFISVTSTELKVYVRGGGGGWTISVDALVIGPA